MDNGSPNSSRGFLGAIKAVTSNPNKQKKSSTPDSESDRKAESVKNVVDQVTDQTVNGPVHSASTPKQDGTKEQSVDSVYEIASLEQRTPSPSPSPSRSKDSDSSESDAHDHAQSTSRDESSAPSVFRSQAVSVEFSSEEVEAQTTSAPPRSETGGFIRSRLIKTIHDQRLGETDSEKKQDKSSGQKTSRSKSTGSADKGDLVLPGNRPALLNQSVDKVLNDLVVGTRDAQYLVEKIRSLIVKNFVNTPTTEITSPDMSIAGPALDLLVHNSHKPVIMQLIANLLSTSMTSSASKFAHPGFVDILRNVTSDEARIIQHMLNTRVIPVIDIKKVMDKTGSYMRLNTLVSTIGVDAMCEHEDLAETYLANLERLGLLEIPRNVQLTDNQVYDRLLNSPPVSRKLQLLNAGGEEFHGEVVKYYAKLSVYGMQFASACIAHGDGIPGVKR